MAFEGLPKDTVVESDALTSAPLWRREPYLLLFPLGVAVSWAGVLHWLLHSLGWLADYRPVFHAQVQIDGFLSCFAAGFLLTMIPRRTGSAPPSSLEMAIALAAPPALALAAWHQLWVAAHGLWLLLAATLIRFAVRRFLGAGSRRRPPNAFVWIPLGLLMGVAGSLTLLYAELRGAGAASIREVGRGLHLQGMFTALVLGVGSLALPLMTRGEAPPDATASPRDRLERLGHVAGGVVLAASFWIGARASLPLGLGLRAAVVLIVLLATARLWRRPRPAWNARVLWLAAWMVPLGYAVAAALPGYSRGGLHVTFIGGFALMALSVATQVTLGHGGYEKIMFGRPPAVPVIAATMLLAVAARLMMELEPERYFRWMGAAAALFLIATVVWAVFLVPKMLRRSLWTSG